MFRSVNIAVSWLSKGAAAQRAICGGAYAIPIFFKQFGSEVVLDDLIPFSICHKQMIFHCANSMNNPTVLSVSDGSCPSATFNIEFMDITIVVSTLSTTLA